MGMLFARFRWAILVGLMGLVVESLVAQAPQEVVLKLRYQPAQTLNYRVSVDGKINLVGEVGVATELQFKGELTQEQVVKEVAEDGSATLLVTVKGKIKLVSQTEGVQSSEREVPATKILMKVAPGGKIIEIKLIESEKSGEQMEVLQDPFLPLTMSASAWNLFAPDFPSKPMKVGETWDISGSTSVPLPNGQTVQTKVTGKGKLLSVERKGESDVAISEIQVEIPELGEIVTKMLPLREMGIEMLVKGGTKSNSRHWIDLSKGLLARSEIDSETRMVVAIQMPENVGGGAMTLQTQTQIKSVIELISIKP